jgi:MFS family permease
MSARELRAAAGLASIFGLRMFGLFAILPVFALYAATLEGGDNHTWVGLALGAYGLAQALLQIPFGRWSDRVGRKPVLYAGLILFAAGSFIAAYADSIFFVIVGRVVQGTGAISAVAIAMTADLTRDEHRAKAMAIIGSMIGIAFAASLVLGPWLNRHIGVPGIFMLIGVLALLAMLVVATLPTPNDAQSGKTLGPVRFKDILANGDLNRLNAGIFVLHAVLMALFVTVPLDLAAAGMAAAAHWQVYALVMGGAFVLMLPGLHFGDRRGYRKAVFIGSIALLALGQCLLWRFADDVNGLGVALLVFFTGFMVLEAQLPAHVSRAAPPGGRGAAVSVYSTAQFLGAFCGGALGGLLLQHLGRSALLGANLVLLAIWFVAALNMRIIDALNTNNYPLPPLDRDRAT